MMSFTGGSYMSQPYTNSEAVRRSMLMPDSMLSSHIHTREPRPPYATNYGKTRARPVSAPLYRDSQSYMLPYRGGSTNSASFRIPLRKRSMESPVSSAAPYAPRRREAFINSALGYPQVQRGPSIEVPEYVSLSDPHLYEYYDRKFEAIQDAARLKRRNEFYRFGTNSSMGRRRIPRRGMSGERDVLYKIAVTTSDRKNASTDAKVFIQIKGSKGKITKTRLTKKAGSVKSSRDVAFRFGRGTTHIFKIRGPELGEIKSIIMEHKGVKKEDSWFLQEVEIVNTKRKKSWLFLCNQWLSMHVGDGQTSRELFPRTSSKSEYEIVVVTGDKRGAGTDANVFITLYGKTGSTPKLHLKSLKTNAFEQGCTDVFTIKSNCVGPLRKIRIEHDNTGFAPGWFLERVVVSDLNNPSWKYFFSCSKWFAKSEGDGMICRDLLAGSRKASKYKVSIFTGNKKGAGTNANVFLTLFGEMGESPEKKLDSTRSSFEKGNTDTFMIETPSVGRLERIRIGHDNSGIGPGWYLDKVIIDDVALGTVYEFPCQRWFSKGEDDGQIFRDLILNVGPMDAAPGIPYIISVSTGNVRNAGTDARVYAILYGGKNNNETSGKIWLEGGNFDKGRTDKFNIEVAKMLSPVSRIDIGHDNSGVASGWYLDQVVINCPSAGMQQLFPCDKWLALDEGVGTIQRTLYETKDKRVVREKKNTWFIWVHTSDISSAGTDANVYFCLYGNKGKSDEIQIDNETNNFERGDVDKFKQEIVDIGKPYKLRVWHDNTGLAAGWHLDRIEMENMATKERYIFPCGRWLAKNEGDGEIVREIPAESKSIKKPLPLVMYSVEVHTGKRMRAGTDANVFINLFGELGDTGDRTLLSSKTNRNKFEKGNTDEFEIEAVTLKKLQKIKIGHDGQNAGSGWFLDKVVVKQLGSDKQTVTFNCDRWFDTNEDDGAIVRELKLGGLDLLSTTSYHVHVKTGDIRSAGTDANVHLKMFGTKGDTGLLKLRTAENTKNKFEKGRTDLFKLEAENIGKIKRIKIGHDGANAGSGWFLDEVRIDIPSNGERYIFACHRWLSVNEGDGELEIEMEPTTKADLDKAIPYEITIWTGNERGSGTDSNVFIQLYGASGKTEETALGNKTDNFEQGQVDKFKIEGADVGRLQKIRIGHDGAGTFSGWFLEKLLIKRFPLKTGKQKKMSVKKRQSTQLSDSDSDDSRSRSPRRRRKESRKKTKYSDEEDDEETETEDYWFFVKRWFAKGEDDHAIVRELVPTDSKGRTLRGALEEVEYKVSVFTGNVFGAGTDANVFLNFYGEKGDTGERELQKSNNINKFETDKEDKFIIKAVDLGKLAKVKIRHDNSQVGAAWFLDRVEIEDPKRKQTYFFPCQRWLATGKDDGQIARELVPVDVSLKKKLDRNDSMAIRKQIALETKAAMTTYNVQVFTSDVFQAGTDANVYIILYGEEDDTGQMFLKSSKTYRDKFERAHTDEFILEAVKIGELKKIKIGHDNSGASAAWHLEKVVIDAPSLGKQWTFPCSRWLAKSKDDGLLERELYPQELETEEYSPCVPYEITTFTSDLSGSSTNADVYIVLYGKELGTEKKSLCTTKQERKDSFKKGAVDKFVLELEDIGNVIEKIRIGHDGSGFGSGWHLQRVEVRKLHKTGKGSTTHTFTCGRWLARDEDDHAIERELVADRVTKEVVGRDGEIKKTDVNRKNTAVAKKYNIDVYTGDKKGGGTDANVFITIVGDKGDTGDRKLHTSSTHRDKFETKNVDKFTMEAVDLGKIYKLRIRHDNSMLNPSWYLDRVEVVDTMENKNYIFDCERWLAKNKDDGKIERTLYVKGYDGDMSSTATFRSSGRVGSVTSLDSVRSSDPFSKSPRINRKQFDLEKVPEGPTVPYTIKVTTGRDRDNGTDSNVWVKIFGPRKAETGRLFLELAGRNRFEPGSVEVFSIDAFEVKEIRKIEIGHDGTAPGTGWYLNTVDVDMPTKGKHYHFVCKDWLARDRGNGHTSRILSVDDGENSVKAYNPLISYEARFFTGDVSEAGTDSQISMTVFGTKGATSPIKLDKIGERFERSREDLIKLELDDIAPLRKIRIALDGKGSRPHWFLDKVMLTNMETGNLTTFKCKKWIGKGKEGAEPVRDLPAYERGKQVIDYTTYKLTVKTSDVGSAGTGANVYVILFGVNGDSGELHLKDSRNNKKPFSRNQTDEFSFPDVLSLGELSKLRVWHDNKGLGSAWHLENIEVQDTKSGKVHTFHCDRWLSTSDDDKQLIRELTCGTSAKPGSSPGGRDRDKVKYSIDITTSDKKDGGMAHNAWIMLEGEKGLSKVFPMENLPQKRCFRRGDTDSFIYNTSNLGKLKQCILGAFEREDKPIHGDGKDAAWHCHQVVITETTFGTKYIFPVKDWIPIEQGIRKRDGKILEVRKVEESRVAAVRNLPAVKYDVIVHTGGEDSSGTNANVSITIYGSNGDSGKRPLKKRFRDLFEKNQVDDFQFEAIDLGDLTKVRIEHDNAGFSPGWYLDHIDIVNTANNTKTTFPCCQWLDKKRGSGELYRELLAAD